MWKIIPVVFFVSALSSQTATAGEYKTRFKEYADSCYHVPKDKLRIIVAPVGLRKSANPNSGTDTTIRPWSQLRRASGSRYTVMQLQPSHLVHRVSQDVLIGLNADFRVNLLSIPDGLTSNEPATKYAFDFTTLGYIDIDPTELPLKFDIQIEEEIGAKTVSEESDFTNTVQGYSGGQCVLKGLYIYLAK